MIFVKFGALLGRFMGPVLRADVKCLGNDNCYPLAFGFPAIVLCVGIIMMVCAGRLFVRKPPSGNLIGKVFGCAFNGLKGKMTSKIKREHWLDYSIEKYGPKLVEDTKSIMRVMAVLVGISLYYSCFFQQNSRWVFQATQMNGDLGFYTLKPDQVIFFNPLTAIFLTPICNFLLYPLIAKCGIKTLVHRISVGGFICVLAFVFATLVEIQIKQNYISMLWLFPQYICAALSEIFVLLSALNFAYENGPTGMKSVMTAMVYLSVALGDSLIPIVSGLKIFKSQAYEFIFFGSLLFINMIVFCVIVSRLDFRTKEELSSDKSDE
jgi:solute carrier family 15 oligopeptide transporter 1